MTNEELENRLKSLVKKERRITGEILILIREAELRRLPAERGFPSVHEWLVKECDYSDAAAYRRIQAARLLSAVPAAEAKLASGALNLTVMAQVQSAIRKEEKKTGEAVATELKEELLSRVEGQRAEKVEKILAEEFPDSAKPKETLRARTSEESSLTITLGEEAVSALKRLRELDSPGTSYADIISKALVDRVNRTDPLKTAAVKRRVRIFRRAKGQCEFVDEKTKRRCSAREHLEIDHIQPRALGGSDDDENLRVLCREHNLFVAEKIFGREKMDQFRNTT